MVWRILIADDHEVVRIGIRDLLEQQQNIVVCAEAADGMQAIAMWHDSKPDIVILDDELPMINGMVVAQRILKYQPKQKILVFGSIESKQVVQQFLKAGVRSLISKTEPVSELLKAICALQQDHVYFTAMVGQVVRRDFLDPDDLPNLAYRREELSIREQEVIQLIAEGRSTKEVASALHISTKTAETHRQNAMSKLDLHNIAQVTRYAIVNGILPAMSGVSSANSNSQEANLRHGLAAACAKAA